MKTRKRSALSPRARSTSNPGITKPNLFRLDGGYIVLDEAAVRRGAEGLSAIAADWREHHFIAITGAPAGATADDLAELGRAAQAFDRVVICESCDAGCATGSHAAAMFARAVRSAGRAECLVVGDPHRALRHCVESMVPGDAVVYCCGDIETAERILGEYGAVPVDKPARTRAEVKTGTRVAPGGTTGELTAARI